jgi:hypothetical protein
MKGELHISAREATHVLIYQTIELLDRMIGFMQYRWQQDDIPAHRPSSEPSEFPARMRLTDWQAKSPDLSPIEPIWVYLKFTAVGNVFANRDALFAFLADE